MALPNVNRMTVALAGMRNELTEIREEVALLPNLPAMNQPQLGQQVLDLQQQFAQIQQQFAQIQQQGAQILQGLNDVNQRLDDVKQRLDQVNERLDRIENAGDLLPLRLYNSSVTYENPLRYPPGVEIEDPIPRTKAELRDLTVAQCIEVAGILNLPALEAGTLVARRRSQISEYLGCAMVF